MGKTQKDYQPRIQPREVKSNLFLSLYFFLQILNVFVGNTKRCQLSYKFLSITITCLNLHI